MNWIQRANRVLQSDIAYKYWTDSGRETPFLNSCLDNRSSCIERASLNNLFAKFLYIQEKEISENFTFTSKILFMVGKITRFSMWHLTFALSMMNFEFPMTWRLSVLLCIAFFICNHKAWNSALLFVPEPAAYLKEV